MVLSLSAVVSDRMDSTDGGLRTEGLLGSPAFDANPWRRGKAGMLLNILGIVGSRSGILVGGGALGSSGISGGLHGGVMFPALIFLAGGGVAIITDFLLAAAQAVAFCSASYAIQF